MDSAHGSISEAAMLELCAEDDTDSQEHRLIKLITGGDYW